MHNKRELLFDFVLENDKGDILITRLYSLDELCNSVDIDMIYEEDSFWLNGEYITNTDDWVCEFKIIDKRQYTTLDDIKGTKVIEGDIVKLPSGECCLIEFSENDFSFVLWVELLQEWMSLCYLKGLKNFEVVGNKYVNKNLLKESA